MQNKNLGSRRRSTRLPLQIAIVITSLDPARRFQEECKTSVVNAHGCGVLLPKRLENGTRVMVELQADGRHANGHIVVSSPIGDNATSWLLGLEFDSPDNFWQIKDPPPDWMSFK